MLLIDPGWSVFGIIEKVSESKKQHPDRLKLTKTALRTCVKAVQKGAIQPFCLLDNIIICPFKRKT